MKKHRVDQKAFDSNFRAGGFNHQINESGRTRKIRSIRNLKEGTSGPERDAAYRNDVMRKLELSDIDF